jgi:hypothetical protein
LLTDVSTELEGLIATCVVDAQAWNHVVTSAFVEIDPSSLPWQQPVILHSAFAFVHFAPPNDWVGGS